MGVIGVTLYHQLLARTFSTLPLKQLVFRFRSYLSSLELRIAASEKKLDLAYIVDDSIPKILVSDVTRLRQILVNLIGNAVKFTDRGTVDVRIAC